MPEIRIYFSWLLYEVSKKLDEVYDGELPSSEKCEEWTESYKEEWEKYEGKILPALTKATGLNFHMPVIDVSLAPFFIPQSEPLIIHFRSYPDEFVDVLTHELIHVLLTDNQVYSTKKDPSDHRLFNAWQKLFGKEHDFHVLVHIPVHALHQYIMIDVLNEPKRLERERAFVKKNMDSYTKSWDYVDKYGYKKIIAQLKQSYKEDY